MTKTTKRFTFLTLILVLLLGLVAGSALADSHPEEEPGDGPQHPVAFFLSAMLADEYAPDDETLQAEYYNLIMSSQPSLGFGNIARLIQFQVVTAENDPDSDLSPEAIKALLNDYPNPGDWRTLYQDTLEPGGNGLGALIGGHHHHGLALGHQKKSEAQPTSEGGPVDPPNPPAGPPENHPVWGDDQGNDGPPGPPPHAQGPKPDKGPGNNNGNGNGNSGNPPGHSEGHPGNNGQGHSNSNGRGHTENTP